jgi:hypothetical protein
VTTSVDVRAKLVDLMRRDLFGPHPQLDADLEREVLQDKPSRFYVGGFILPAYDAGPPTAQDEDEEAEKVADDLLATETLDSPTEPEADEQETPDQPPKDRWHDLLDSVVAVHRLQAVTCLSGFTRLEPAPTMSEALLEDVHLVDGAPLAENADWLPAMVQRGEGIFLKIGPKAIRAGSQVAKCKHAAASSIAGSRVTAGAMT